ncbi:MAG: FMN-binding protein [Gammaproteobacteria bacterium]|nr:FMN-binding protein [Gammaproteobacteria bacterium]MCW8988146.1 FMN-binding protein [Gammaproteobacteria bacterium]MCW9031911.1 FMN-binding protein [Gammaproteobacteria bacterium]
MMKKQILIYLSLLLCVSPLQARGTYQEPAAFLNETFKTELPQAKVIWLTGETGKTVEKILQHKPSQLRIRYWLKEQRSAWILEEVGKDELITVGIVINNNKIERVKVLIFRESRGDEIRHDFFTQQFKQATIQADSQLDRSIDGISGATMSVRALTKLSRMALFLSSQIKQP